MGVQSQQISTVARQTRKKNFSTLYSSWLTSFEDKPAQHPKQDKIVTMSCNKQYIYRAPVQIYIYFVISIFYFTYL